MSFTLRNLEDLKEIMSHKCNWFQLGLVLKEWGVDFNPKHECVTVQLIWVIILGLPMPFWRKDIVEFIGNKIGMFMSLEEGWDPKTNQ